MEDVLFKSLISCIMALYSSRGSWTTSPSVDAGGVSWAGGGTACWSPDVVDALWALAGLPCKSQQIFLVWLVLPQYVHFLSPEERRPLPRPPKSPRPPRPLPPCPLESETQADLSGIGIRGCIAARRRSSL